MNCALTGSLACGLASSLAIDQPTAGLSAAAITWPDETELTWPDATGAEWPAA